MPASSAGWGNVRFILSSKLNLNILIQRLRWTVYVSDLRAANMAKGSWANRSLIGFLINWQTADSPDQIHFICFLLFCVKMMMMMMIVMMNLGERIQTEACQIIYTRGLVLILHEDYDFRIDTVNLYDENRSGSWDDVEVTRSRGRECRLCISWTLLSTSIWNFFFLNISLFP